MEDNKQIKNDEQLEKASGGRTSGTWVPVDEECPEFNNGSECPFYPIDRHFENCGICMHKNDA